MTQQAAHSTFAVKPGHFIPVDLAGTNLQIASRYHHLVLFQTGLSGLDGYEDFIFRNTDLPFNLSSGKVDVTAGQKWTHLRQKMDPFQLPRATP